MNDMTKAEAVALEAYDAIPWTRERDPAITAILRVVANAVVAQTEGACSCSLVDVTGPDGIPRSVVGKLDPFCPTHNRQRGA